MLPVFTSFFTETYEAEARALIATLDAHGLQYDIRSMPGRGSWVQNCAMKPEFIRDRMLDHAGRAIVWVDADARIKKPPILFDEIEADFAAHWKDGSELLSGTLFFGPTPGAWRLVQEWVTECHREPEVWDQKSLQKIIMDVPGLIIRHLPPTYTAIFDAKMCEPEESVILHLQASRRLRH